MIPNREQCVEETNNSNIKVEELKRKAIFHNPNHEDYLKIRVDGCVITQGIAADYAVEKIGVGTIIVELKGKDLERAADQVSATTRFWIKTVKSPLPIAGLVIGSQFPKSPASFLKKRAAYTREFKSQLHAVNNQGTFILEALLPQK